MDLELLLLQQAEQGPAFTRGDVCREGPHVDFAARLGRLAYVLGLSRVRRAVLANEGQEGVVPRGTRVEYLPDEGRQVCEVVLDEGLVLPFPVGAVREVVEQVVVGTVRLVYEVDIAKSKLIYFPTNQGQ